MQMLQGNMDFSSLNPRSSNSLNLAARTNDVVNVRRLLNKINPNCVDNRGWTCLHEAAFYDSYQCLKLILEHPSCRPLVESHEGHTALYVACLNTRAVRCIKLLLEKVDDIANYGSKEGFTPLHLVSRQGRVDVMQMLIEHGAIVNVQDFDGDTPLHEACLARQPMAVNILLHAGADPEVQNERMVTPLHMACTRGVLQSVEYLMPFITQMNVAACNGDTPLIGAVFGENEHIVELLLARGADPNIKNNCGKLPLDIALQIGSVKLFSILCSITDINALNTDLVYRSLSPHYLNIEIVELLLRTDLPTDFFMYAEPWLVQQHRAILDNKCMPYYDTFAPLNIFISVCEYIFLVKGASKMQECFYLYLMRGASVNAECENELPPLVWIQFCPHNACFDLVFEILLEHNCNIDYFNVHPTKKFILEDRRERLEVNQKNCIPDVFLASLTMDPGRAYLMLPYSLHCDPEYILKLMCYGPDHFKAITYNGLVSLLLMIDDDLERVYRNMLLANNIVNEYQETNCTTICEALKCHVMPLKHLSRMAIRKCLRCKDGKVKSTKEYLDMLELLPLPRILKYYIRFI